MVRLFLITFGLLGWAWYEMSGGTDFVAGDHGVKVLASAPAYVPVSEQPIEVVARDEPAADLNAIIQPALAVAQRPAQVKTVYAPSAANTGTDSVANLPAADDKLAMLVNPAVMNDAMPADETEVSFDQTVTLAAVVDYRKVSASRVNLRGGPSTSYDVVTQLLRGEEVEVLDDTGDGWVKLRALDGSDIGWMADDFLTASN